MSELYGVMNATIKHIIDSISDIYHEESPEMAYWIVEEMAGLSRWEASVRKDPIELEGLEEVIKRLRAEEPLQYIFGHTLWRGLNIAVDSHTLIPRPETAELVDWVLEENMDEARVADIGTGSGCIAIALKKAREMWHVEGLDISEDALCVAQSNGKNNGVEVDWKRCDILDQDSLLHHQYDIVVSNPPYIPRGEYRQIRKNVVEYEPHLALFVDDDDPLLFYREIARKKVGRVVYFEIHENYAQEMKVMMEEMGYQDILIRKDMYGKERMLRGRLEE